MSEAKEARDKSDVEKQMFPPCNAEWTQADGSRFWCTKKSGGVTRSWVGVPRRLFYPGRWASFLTNIIFLYSHSKGAKMRVCARYWSTEH